MNTFRVVYSVKALFAARSAEHTILFDNAKAHSVFSEPIGGCCIVQKHFSGFFGAQMDPSLTEPRFIEGTFITILD